MSKEDKGRQMGRRRPKQARALHKFQTMLDAAMQLLEVEGIEGLTTNGVAEKAGVSIGTLYQYFDNRQSILNALAKREVEAMVARVVNAVKSEPPADADLATVAEVRIRRVVNAVLQAYGGRRKVHRELIERAMNAGSETKLAPLCAEIFELLLSDANGPRYALSPAHAFVVTYAVAGVLRGLVSRDVGTVPHDEVVDVLVGLIKFVLQADGVTGFS